ncbi:uncharacterized protein LOC135809863 isoform X1 [Sycon ciliatum]|uniref:uncharacterized protein LOC135809863 isoform X1 n=1 Tax=Sycon ciliatum TaxID=27933 RepID=UPI0031F6679F
MTDFLPYNERHALRVLSEIGRSLRTLLGPNRRTKCSVDSDGKSYALFSDVVTLLDELQVVHPVGTLFRDFCHSCANHTASCVTTTAVLVCLMAGSLSELLQKGIPQDVLVKMLAKVSDICVELARETAISVLSLDGTNPTKSDISSRTSSDPGKPVAVPQLQHAAVSAASSRRLRQVSRHFSLSTSAASHTGSLPSASETDRCAPWLRNLCMGVSRQGLGGVLYRCCMSMVDASSLNRGTEVLERRLKFSVIVHPVLGTFGSTPFVHEGIALLVDDGQMQVIAARVRETPVLNVLLVDGDLAVDYHAAGHLKTWSSKASAYVRPPYMGRPTKETIWLERIREHLDKLNVHTIVVSGGVDDDVIALCHYLAIPVLECSHDVMTVISSTYGLMAAETLLSANTYHVIKDMVLSVERISDSICQVNSQRIVLDDPCVPPRSRNIVRLKSKPSFTSEFHAGFPSSECTPCCSVFLTAATHARLAMIEADFKSALKRLRNALKFKLVLPGAGALEMKCARKLQELSERQPTGYSSGIPPTKACKSKPAYGNRFQDAQETTGSSQSPMGPETVSQGTGYAVQHHVNGKATVSSLDALDGYERLAYREFSSVFVKYLSQLLLNSGWGSEGYIAEVEVQRCMKAGSDLPVGMCDDLGSCSSGGADVYDCLHGKLSAFQNSAAFLSTVITCDKILCTRTCNSQQ